MYILTMVPLLLHYYSFVLKQWPSFEIAIRQNEACSFHYHLPLMCQVLNSNIYSAQQTLYVRSLLINCQFKFRSCPNQKYQRRFTVLVLTGGILTAPFNLSHLTASRSLMEGSYGPRDNRLGRAAFGTIIATQSYVLGPMIWTMTAAASPGRSDSACGRAQDRRPEPGHAVWPDHDSDSRRAPTTTCNRGPPA